MRTLLPALLLLIPSLCLSVTDEWTEAHRVQLDDLFEALAGSGVPEASASSQHWVAGQPVEACHRLIHYYRSRPSRLPGLVSSLILPIDGRPLADAWMADRVSPLGFEAELQRLPSGKVDWYQRGPDNEKEFAWMLNRHLILPLLLSAHEQSQPSGSMPYIDAAQALISDWVTSNPYPHRLTFSPPWRALEAARRILDSWAPSFDLLRKDFSDEALLLFLSALPHHADALDEHASIWGGNHLITEKIALILIALQWPEFTNAENWLSDALQTVVTSFIRQTYPDGAYIELSNHYQKIVLQNLQHLLYVMQLSGRESPEPLVERLETAWNFYARTSKPDGSGPLNNDSDYEPGKSLIENAAAFYGRNDWLYIATHGEQGTPPASISPAIFPWAGQSILRDRYAADSDWAYFDSGPYGTAHQHNDPLHVSLMLNGEEFLVDQGRYSYSPDAWRDYFTGLVGHNTAEFQGLEVRPRPHKRRVPVDPVLLSDGNWTVLCAEQWHDAPTRGERPSWLHRRFLLHETNAGFLIIDHLIGYGTQAGTLRWHFSPQRQRSEIERHFQLHTTTTPLAEPVWQKGVVTPIAGWHSQQYGEKEPAWQIDYTVQIKQPEVFVWSVGRDPVDTLMANRESIKITTKTGILTLQLKNPRATFQPTHTNRHEDQD